MPEPKISPNLLFTYPHRPLGANFGQIRGSTLEADLEPQGPPRDARVILQGPPGAAQEIPSDFLETPDNRKDHQPSNQPAIGALYYTTHLSEM